MNIVHKHRHGLVACELHAHFGRHARVVNVGRRPVPDAARQAAARSVNALMTASYWEIGRRIAEAEKKGWRPPGYGEQLMERLSADLTARLGRGFGVNNLESMRRFFLAYPQPEISQTVSRKFDLCELTQVFTLPLRVQS